MVTTSGGRGGEDGARDGWGGEGCTILARGVCWNGTSQAGRGGARIVLAKRMLVEDEQEAGRRGSRVVSAVQALVGVEQWVGRRSSKVVFAEQVAVGAEMYFSSTKSWQEVERVEVRWRAVSAWRVLVHIRPVPERQGRQVAWAGLLAVH